MVVRVPLEDVILVRIQVPQHIQKRDIESRFLYILVSNKNT